MFSSAPKKSSVEVLFPTKPICVIGIADVTLRFLCAFHGLQTGFPRVRRLSFVLWFVCVVTSPLTTWIYFYLTVYLATQHVSLSSITTTIAAFNFLLGTLFTIFVFIVKHDAIEKLLKSHVRDATDVFIPLACCVPSLTMYVSSLIRMNDVAVLIAYPNFMIFTISMTIHLMVHLNLINNVLQKLKRLHVSLGRAGGDWSSVALEKLRIRKDLQTINSLFALPLSMHFIQFYAAVLFNSAAMMGSTMRSYEDYLLLISGATPTVNLLLVACKGSRVVSQFLEIENLALSLSVTANTVSRNGKQLEAMNIFRFREEWDTVQALCFTLNIGGFLKFMLTVFTCTAVILQFDYKVVRSITSLAESRPT